MKFRAIGLALAVTCVVAAGGRAGAQYGMAPPGGPMMPPGGPMMPGALPPGGPMMGPNGAMMGGYPGMPPVMPYPSGPMDGCGCGAPCGCGPACGCAACGGESCGCCEPCGCEEGCLNFGRGGGCGCEGGCEPDGTPHWRARLEASLLSFKLPDSPASLSTLNGTNVLGIGSLNFDDKLNARLSIEARLPNDQSIECVFLGFGHWSDNAAVLDAAGRLLSPYQSLAGANVVPYDLARQHEISYGSDFFNFEVNYWVPVVNCRYFQGSLMLGGRYLRISEDFDYSAIRVIGANTVTGDTAINAHDNIAAVQTGAMGWVPLNHQFSLRGDAKAGFGYNFADQSTDITVRGSAVAAQNITYSENPDTQKGAFLFELSGVMMWQLNCNVAIYTGYQALWLNDLVLAPEQFNPIFPTNGVRPVHIDDTGHRLYHGVLAGLEFTW